MQTVPNGPHAGLLEVKKEEDEDIKSEIQNSKQVAVSEIKSENEDSADENQLNIFGNIVAPNLIKKKKKKITEEKQKMLEKEHVSYK